MNRKQREFLVEICEKVAVYTVTAGLIGKFLSRELSNRDLLALVLVSVVLIAAGLQVAKGVR